MVWLIRIGVPLLILAGAVFGEVKLAQLLFSHLPLSLGAWLFWVKVVTVFALIWLTAGIVIILTVLSGAIAVAITE